MGGGTSLCSISQTPLTHFPWWNVSGVGQPGWLQARRRETERAKDRRGEAKGPGWEGTWRGRGQRELVQQWGPTVFPDHLASTIVPLMVPPDGLGVFPEGLLSPTQRRKNQPVSICLPLLALENPSKVLYSPLYSYRSFSERMASVHLAQQVPAVGVVQVSQGAGHEDGRWDLPPPSSRLCMKPVALFCSFTDPRVLVDTS